MSENQACSDQLLSAFEVVRSTEYEQGRPYTQTHLRKIERLPPSCEGPLRLKELRNWNRHWYAESHIEEWVSRCPETLFSSPCARVIGSQNYAHLSEKIDLLFLDSEQHFHIVEIKAERVASNRGIAPDRIWSQMNRYVGFVRNELMRYPANLELYYGQFTKQSLGSCCNLAADVQLAFGNSLSVGSAGIVRTFITEGYDSAAASYFRNRHCDEAIRMIYYRFFRGIGDIDRHFIEFWEMCLPIDLARVPQSFGTIG